MTASRNNIQVMPWVRIAWNSAISSKLRLRACYSTANPKIPPAVGTIVSSFSTVDINEFRERAFIPEKPILITARDGYGTVGGAADVRNSQLGLPASHKWLLQPTELSGASILSIEYLSKFGNTILPYELVIDSKEDTVRNWIREHGHKDGNESLSTILGQLLEISNGECFHRFNAPLSFFLQACKASSPTLQRLYIAQAQIADLPKGLQDDLPTPQLVKDAGKGDVYDANIWLGIPPTYTPLHKDPNPNLFVQLASSKRIRLFPPNVGVSIFHQVQQRIGLLSSASFRGNEMMEGLEREALDQAVWSDLAPNEGFEATVRAGDALFIPKGWWHSIKSVGNDVTASVNWWFR